MKLEEATFDNVRNIERFSFGFDPDMNIIFGKNAQGKTNVIEGIYLFAGGKSFRRVKDADMRKFGTEITQLSAKFESGGRDHVRPGCTPRMPARPRRPRRNTRPSARVIPEIWSTRSRTASSRWGTWLKSPASMMMRPPRR